MDTPVRTNGPRTAPWSLKPTPSVGVVRAGPTAARTAVYGPIVTSWYTRLTGPIYRAGSVVFEGRLLRSGFQALAADSVFPDREEGKTNSRSVGRRPPAAAAREKTDRALDHPRVARPACHSPGIVGQAAARIFGFGGQPLEWRGRFVLGNMGTSRYEQLPTSWSPDDVVAFVEIGDLGRIRAPGAWPMATGS